MADLRPLTANRSRRPSDRAVAQLGCDAGAPRRNLREIDASTTSTAALNESGHSADCADDVGVEAALDQSTDWSSVALEVTGQALKLGPTPRGVHVCELTELSFAGREPGDRG